MDGDLVAGKGVPWQATDWHSAPRIRLGERSSAPSGHRTGLVALAATAGSQRDSALLQAVQHGTTIARCVPPTRKSVRPHLMRIQLLSLLTCLFAVACADHNGTVGVNAPKSDPTDAPGGVGGGGGGGGNGSSAAQNQGSTGSSPTGTGSGATSGGSSGSGGGGSSGGGPVPEPSTLLLVGTGLAGAALLRRRRDQKQA